jgi:hypothetical protein
MDVLYVESYRHDIDSDFLGYVLKINRNRYLLSRIISDPLVTDIIFNRNGFMLSELKATV